MLRQFIVVMAVIVALSGINARSIKAEETTAFTAGEMLVKFKRGTSAQAAAAIHRRNGGAAQSVIHGIDVHVVRVPSDKQSAMLAAYQQNGNVEYAELNQTYQAAAIWTPNDPKIGDQWHYNNTGQNGGVADADIDAFEAWGVQQGSSAIPIAILDSGIDQTHEDLRTKIVKNVNFSDSVATKNSKAFDDRYGHGTHVAGIAAAATNNGVGVAGTCPNCQLYNVKVANDSLQALSSWLANGIIWAADNGARVINISFGSYTHSQAVEDAVNYAWSKGAILTASAGNDNRSDAWYPAAYPNVIAVGAITNTGTKDNLSNYGSWVDVAAPGKDIYSTFPDHASTYAPKGIKYGVKSGTSMAAPQVAGLAGLLWSSNMCSTNTCVRERIENYTDERIENITDTSGNIVNWTNRVINAYESLTRDAPLPPPPPTTVFANLDNDPVTNWLRYVEGPTGFTISDLAESVIDPTAPSGDNTSFHMAITSSSSYANVYRYQSKALVTAPKFTYKVKFKWSAGGGQPPQGLEFPFSIYTGTQRLEAAMQWLHGHDGKGARWRVWAGPNAGYWTDTKPSGESWNFVQTLAPDVWHTFSMDVTIQNNQITYHSFTVDGQTFNINTTYNGFSDGTRAQTVIAYQIDNNYWGNRQDVWLDEFALEATP